MQLILHLSQVFIACSMLMGCEKNSQAAPGGTQPPPAEITGTAVALGGNAFITQAANGGAEIINEDGLHNWTNTGATCTGWFRTYAVGELQVGLRLKVPDGVSKIKMTINGTAFTISADNRQYKNVAGGKITLTAPGYVKVTLQGESKTGTYFADVSDFIIAGGAATGAKFANDPANYYWSRRGPSVHLGYPVAAGTDVEYFYNEMTIPAGEDRIGSYFMSNGFSEGYFGIQVNSATERRILFSVWDPPAGQGITESIKHGDDVQVQRFGGEGTGGQSYLRFDWKAGNTYSFLTRATPDGQGNTLYSAWFFAPETSHWKFIATWKRPNTSKHLTGLHSFLENFIDKNGWLERKCFYNNQWIVTTGGQWQELTRAKFTGDATARNAQRLDFNGGLDANGKFYLRNGGFFNETGQLNQEFTRNATNAKPQIDLSTLP
jgi:hypothetical protein